MRVTTRKNDKTIVIKTTTNFESAYQAYLKAKKQTYFAKIEVRNANNNWIQITPEITQP